MRMAKKNISFVKRLEKDGMTYNWFVKMKDGDAHDYINYRDGRTAVEEYKADRLPKAVQSFVEDHPESIWTDERESTGFAVYIYR